MGQGLFESDDDYRARTVREANEQAIKGESGSAPSHGLFESESEYSARISKEANEHRIKATTGIAPSQGLFEGDDSYRSRIEIEANENAIAASTDQNPTQGLFESDHVYSERVRREANEQAIADATGQLPRQGLFEGEHDYRSRIAHEAREIAANGRAGPGRRQADTSDKGLSRTFPNNPSASNYRANAATNNGATRKSFVVIPAVMTMIILTSYVCLWIAKYYFYPIKPNSLLELAWQLIGLLVFYPLSWPAQIIDWLIRQLW